VRPSVKRLSEVSTEVYKDGLETKFASNSAWDLGMYFMEPGMTTIIFSTEEKDDGTADEWYGSAFEFYYIITGQFTVWFAKKTADLKKKRAPRLMLNEGDVASYPPGWKYMVKNTGVIPGAFFWGKTAPRKEVKVRLIKRLKTIG
jgi:mannose-6-phosphate isomerase-like protein (cupin superfamily)